MKLHINYSASSCFQVCLENLVEEVFVCFVLEIIGMFMLMFCASIKQVFVLWKGKGHRKFFQIMEKFISIMDVITAVMSLILILAKMIITSVMIITNCHFS